MTQHLVKSRRFQTQPLDGAFTAAPLDNCQILRHPKQYKVVETTRIIVLQIIGINSTGKTLKGTEIFSEKNLYVSKPSPR